MTVLLKCPVCPMCGAPPSYVTEGCTQAFCSSDGETCSVISWNPVRTALENLKDRQDITLN